MELSAINYDAQGLVPVVIQDWNSGEVLTLAYASAEAVARTRETGELHLWSRSRNELWHKGATSGNTMAVEEIADDCDGDALLYRVRPNGPACHTGAESCFAPWLWRIVAERAATRFSCASGQRGLRATRARCRASRPSSGGRSPPAPRSGRPGRTPPSS